MIRMPARARDVVAERAPSPADVAAEVRRAHMTSISTDRAIIYRMGSMLVAIGACGRLAAVAIAGHADALAIELAVPPRHMASLGGRAATLNALTVELADTTADVVGDNAIDALWLLKERGLVEHTVDAPVLWRLAVPR